MKNLTTATVEKAFSIESVSYEGIYVSGKLITWTILRSAATQEDPELRKIYADILSDARRRVCGNRRMPIIIGVRYDPSGRSESYATDASGQQRHMEFIWADGDGQGTRGECELCAAHMRQSAEAKGYRVVSKPTILPDGTRASRRK